MSEGTYSVHVRCNNCGWCGRLDIECGHTVCGTACGRCRCHRLEPVLTATHERAMVSIDELASGMGLTAVRDRCKCVRERDDAVLPELPRGFEIGGDVGSCCQTPGE